MELREELRQLGRSFKTRGHRAILKSAVDRHREPGAHNHWYWRALVCIQLLRLRSRFVVKHASTRVAGRAVSRIPEKLQIGSQPPIRAEAPNLQAIAARLAGSAGDSTGRLALITILNVCTSLRSPHCLGHRQLSVV